MASLKTGMVDRRRRRVSKARLVITAVTRPGTRPSWASTGRRKWPDWGTKLDGEIVVYGSRRLSHALIGWAWWTSCAYWCRWCLVPGDRLFGEAQDKVALRLVESRPSGGGVVSMIYAPASANG